MRHTAIHVSVSMITCKILASTLTLPVGMLEE